MLTRTHRDEAASVEIQLDKASEEAMSGTSAYGAIPALVLCASFGLLLVTIADALSRSGRGGGSAVFWLGILAITAPITWRITSPEASRTERITLAVLAGIALYGVKLVHDPFGFTFADELAHQQNVTEILRTGTLFGRNSTLPVTSLYPGLESATAALASTTGLSPFGAGILVIGAARVITSLAIFMLVEKLLDSSRAAALSVLLFCGAPNFLYFTAEFSYESLALPLTLAVVYAVAAQRAATDERRQHGWRAFAFALVPAVVITHHVSAYVLVGELLAICFVAVLLTPPLQQTRRERPVAFTYAVRDDDDGLPGYSFSTAEESRRDLLNRAWHAATSRRTGPDLSYIPWELPRPEETAPPPEPTWRRSYAPWAITAWTTAWVVAVLVFVGQRTTDYLSPVISDAISLTVKAASKEGTTRAPFQSNAGVVAPVWERGIAIAAVLAVVIWMPFGLLSIWRKVSLSPIVAVFSGASLLYLLTLPLRLVPAAWESSIRASTFLFIGCATILAGTELGRHRRWSRGLVTFAAALIIAGGIISGWPSNIRLSSPYRLAAEHSSIDPPSVTLARWAQRNLPEGRRFAAEQSDARMLSALGDQDALSGVYPDVQDLLHSPTLEDWQPELLRAQRIEYIAVNRRKESSNALTGYFFASPTSKEGAEFDPIVIEKFDREPWTDRIFDNGTIVVYDIHRLPDATATP